MTDEEASEYARRLYKDATNSELIQLFDSVRKLPFDIRFSIMALKDRKSMEEIIKKALSVALRDFSAFEHKPKISKLKKSPDGVSAESFDGIYYNGILLSQPKNFISKPKKLKINRKGDSFIQVQHCRSKKLILFYLHFTKLQISKKRGEKI